MGTILQGAPQMLCFIDYILITGSSEEEHLKNLKVVLRFLQAHGVQLKQVDILMSKNQVNRINFKKPGVHRLHAPGLIMD